MLALEVAARFGRVKTVGLVLVGGSPAPGFSGRGFEVEPVAFGLGLLPMLS